ncbi:MAG: hypothetical protein WAO49_05850 [Arcanobacterium sp.]
MFNVFYGMTTLVQNTVLAQATVLGQSGVLAQAADPGAVSLIRWTGIAAMAVGIVIIIRRFWRNR